MGVGTGDLGYVPYQVCTNGESGLTLTFITARSNLIPNALAKS